MLCARGAKVWAAVALVAAAACGGEDFSSSGEAGGGPGSSGTSSASVGAGGDGSGECAPGSACMPAVPEGWQGPVAIYVGDAPPNGCPAPFAELMTGNVGEVEAPHTCTPCGCGEPDVSCSPPTVSIYSNADCGGSPTKTIVPQPDNVCMAVDGYYGAKVTQQSQEVGTGTCAKTGGIAEKSDAVWSEGAALVCAGPVSPPTCEAGVCVPQLDEPFRSAMCVYKSDIGPCPAGFEDRVIVYRGVVDGRSCTECVCGVSTQTSCSNPVIAYSGGPGCTNVNATISAIGTCADVFFNSITWDDTPKQAACKSFGGIVQGSLEPAEPVSVCCVGSS